MAAAQGEWPTSVPTADQGASLASGLATGQEASLATCPQYGQAAAEGTFGTKVKAGDEDVGIPLSLFSASVGTPPAIMIQFNAWVSYWDIGTTPGFYDDQDVAYLQFGSNIFGPLRIVRANNIRLTGWGPYPAGSYVKPGDSDIGQILVQPPQAGLPSGIQADFYYMDVIGGAGYDVGDPVYLKVQSPIHLFGPPLTGTNDIRITANAGFPAGSRVSLNDPDAAKPLTLFMPPVAIPPAGGPIPTSPAVGLAVAQLGFFNANGNVIAPPGSQAIYDDGDVVYFDINPLGVVSPNDIRLY